MLKDNPKVNNSSLLPDWIQKARGKVVRLKGAGERRRGRGHAIAKLVSTIEKGDKLSVSVLYFDGSSEVIDPQHIMPGFAGDEDGFNKTFQKYLRAADAKKTKGTKAKV